MDLIENFLSALKHEFGEDQLSLEECIELYDEDWYDYDTTRQLMENMFVSLSGSELEILTDFFWQVITPDIYGIYHDTMKSYQNWTADLSYDDRQFYQIDYLLDILNTLVEPENPFKVNIF